MSGLHAGQGWDKQMVAVTDEMHPSSPAQGDAGRVCVRRHGMQCFKIMINRNGGVRTGEPGGAISLEHSVVFPNEGSRQWMVEPLPVGGGVN